MATTRLASPKQTKLYRINLTWSVCRWNMWILTGFVFLLNPADIPRVRSCEAEWIHEDVIPFLSASFRAGLFKQFKNLLSTEFCFIINSKWFWVHSSFYLGGIARSQGSISQPGDGFFIKFFIKGPPILICPHLSINLSTFRISGQALKEFELYKWHSWNGFIGMVFVSLSSV